MSQFPYFSEIGFVIYIIIYTRSNLSCGINSINRYMANPDKEHWILYYLHGSSEVCLQFEKCKDQVVGVVNYNFTEYIGRN